MLVMIVQAAIPTELSRPMIQTVSEAINIYSSMLRVEISWVRIPVKARNVSLPEASRTILSPTHPPIQLIPVFFVGDKLARP